jgi:hypothetical protein
MVKDIYSMTTTRLKEFFANTSYFYAWALTPLVMAFVLPNLLEPQWKWRMFTLFLSMFGLWLVILRIVLIPSLLKRDIVRGGTRTRATAFFVSYLALVVIGLSLPVFFLWPSTSDLYKSLTNQNPFVTEHVFVENTRTGGITTLAGQDLIISGESYILPFFWGVIKPKKEYFVIYSPSTKFIYEIHPLESDVN